MKPLSRTRTALTAVIALTVLPAGAASAQEDCEVVQGPGSAAADVECPEETGVLPGRFDRPDAAPADEDEDTDTAGAPAVESTDAELAATGIDAETAALTALAALALGGGALVASRRRTRTDS